MKGIEIVYLPIDKIKPYERNAKKHPANQVEHIANSIREFGFRQPLVVDAENVLVIGHGRLLAAKKLGMAEVPVVRADDLTTDQIKALRLADNKTNESEWEEELLNLELGDILNISMSDFGFEDIDGLKTADEVLEDEYDEDPPEEPKSKLGDIYQLGEHRLMCGDSTSAEDVEKLMNGEKADMVFTDPPYGVAIGSRNKAINAVEPGRGGHIETDIEGDTMSEEELYEMLKNAFTNLREIAAKDSCSFYVTSPQGGSLGLMMMMMKDAGLPVRHILIWVKNTAVFSLGRLDYDYRHEPIFYTWTSKHNFYGDYSTTVIDDSEPIDKMSKAELKELVRAYKEKKPDSVIYCDKPSKSTLHPTMKPLKLIARFIVNSSKRGDNVVDIFGGSGSTMMSAEQLGRRCFMMELDPHYVDVIIDRWEKFTGRKAKLIESR